MLHSENIFIDENIYTGTILDIVIISRVEVHQYAIGVRRFMRKSPPDYFWNSQFRSTNSHKESAQVFFSVYLIRKRLLSN